MLNIFNTEFNSEEFPVYNLCGSILRYDEPYIVEHIIVDKTGDIVTIRTDLKSGYFNAMEMEL